MDKDILAFASVIGRDLGNIRGSIINDGKSDILLPPNLKTPGFSTGVSNIPMDLNGIKVVDSSNLAPISFPEIPEEHAEISYRQNTQPNSDPQLEFNFEKQARYSDIDNKLDLILEELRKISKLLQSK